MINYFFIGLIGMVVLLGTGLYKQIQANGIYQANEETMQAVIDNQHQQFMEQMEERKRVESLLAENQQKQRTIVKEKEVVKQVIKEVQIHAKPEDCVHQPMPDDLVCLFTTHCGERGRSTETISTQDTAD